MKLESFDPPMCCSTGVCGPEVDPKLAQYASDLEWLKRQGIEVVRYNLAQEPAAFGNYVTVKNTLTQDGNDCLPVILVDGKIVSKAQFPDREALATFVGRQSDGVAVAMKADCQPTPAIKGGKCCG